MKHACRRPGDIAKGIVFLASDDAAFMTGAGLVVDGGLTAQ
ncbi:MAG TPA: SDR family oxidoreductase [Nevskia sp.]|nr:SDR family oxidoreductase [Nevskia sp.]